MNVFFTLALFADPQSYNNGRLVGQIVGYVMIGVVGLWVIGKVLRR
jgi:hypothetical protein